MKRLNVSTTLSRSVSTMRDGQRVIEFFHKEGQTFLEVDSDDYPELVQMLASQLSWEQKRELATELEEAAMEGEFDNY